MRAKSAASLCVLGLTFVLIGGLVSCNAKKNNPDAVAEEAQTPQNKNKDPLAKFLSVEENKKYQLWKNSILKECGLQEVLDDKKKSEDEFRPSRLIDYQLLMKRNQNSRFIQIAPNHYAQIESGLVGNTQPINWSLKDPETNERATLRAQLNGSTCTLSLDDKVIFSTEIFQNLVVWGDFNLNKRVAPVLGPFGDLDESSARRNDPPAEYAVYGPNFLNKLFTNFLKPNDQFFEDIATYLQISKLTAKSFFLEFETSRDSDQIFYLKTQDPWPVVDFGGTGSPDFEPFFLKDNLYREFRSKRFYFLNLQFQFLSKPYTPVNPPVSGDQTDGEAASEPAPTVKSEATPFVFNFVIQVTPPLSGEQNSTLNLQKGEYVGAKTYTMADYANCIKNRFDLIKKATKRNGQMDDPSDPPIESINPPSESLKKICRVYQPSDDGEAAVKASVQMIVKYLDKPDNKNIQDFGHWDDDLIYAFEQAKLQKKSFVAYLELGLGTPAWVNQVDIIWAQILKMKENFGSKFPARLEKLPIYLAVKGIPLDSTSLQKVLGTFLSFGDTLPKYFDGIFESLEKGHVLDAEDMKALDLINAETIAAFQALLKKSQESSFVPISQGTDAGLWENKWSGAQIRDLSLLIDWSRQFYIKNQFFADSSFRFDTFALNLYRRFPKGIAFIQETFEALKTLDFVFELNTNDFMNITVEGVKYDVATNQYLKSLAPEMVENLKISSNISKEVGGGWFGTFYLGIMISQKPDAIEIARLKDLSVALWEFNKREKQRVTETSKSALTNSFPRFFNLAQTSRLSAQDIFNFERLSVILNRSAKCQSPGHMDAVSNRSQCIEDQLVSTPGGIWNPEIKDILQNIVETLNAVLENNRNPFSKDWTTDTLTVLFSAPFLKCPAPAMAASGQTFLVVVKSLTGEPESLSRSMKLQNALVSLSACPN